MNEKTKKLIESKKKGTKKLLRQLEEFDRRFHEMENPKESKITMECRFCKKTLLPKYGRGPENPVFGHMYTLPLEALYCPECGLMYQSLES